MRKRTLGLGAAVLVVLAGCAHQAQPPAAQPPAVPTAATAPPPTTTPVPAETAPRQAVVYTVDPVHGSNADNYLVKHTVTLTSPKDPAREAVVALIDAPGSPIPAGTRLLSVKIADGQAMLDFSQSPVDETGGEERQAQALEAIQRTLGQFPNVSTIQILVHGQPPASLGEAAGGPMDVLRPGENAGNSGGA